MSESQDLLVAADYLDEGGFDEAAKVLREKAEEIRLRGLGGDVAGAVRREDRRELRELGPLASFAALRRRHGGRRDPVQDIVWEGYRGGTRTAYTVPISGLGFWASLLQSELGSRQ
jgi:hypothetical protein